MVGVDGAGAVVGGLDDVADEQGAADFQAHGDVAEELALAVRRQVVEDEGGEDGVERPGELAPPPLVFKQEAAHRCSVAVTRECLVQPL